MYNGSENRGSKLLGQIDSWKRLYLSYLILSYETQIDDLAMPDRNPMHLTVAIYGLAPASNKIVSKQTGQWNTFEIQVID